MFEEVLIFSLISTSILVSSLVSLRFLLKPDKKLIEDIVLAISLAILFINIIALFKATIDVLTY